MSGELGKDKLFGNSGHDYLSGDYGRDYLHGGKGDDTLNGGAHRDRLFGGTGENTLTGGDGADTFIFEDINSTDTITDFTLGLDRIRIGSGADELEDLTIVDVSYDSVITFGAATIVVENIDAATLVEEGTFLF